MEVIISDTRIPPPINRIARSLPMGSLGSAAPAKPEALLAAPPARNHADCLNFITSTLTLPEPQIERWAKVKRLESLAIATKMRPNSVPWAESW